MLSLDSISIFCINLTKYPEKYEKVKKILEKYQLNVTRWNADTPETVTYNMIGYLSDTQKACTASHLNLFQHILNNNIEVALILEDNASFRKDWKEIVNNKLKTINADDPEWDCLFLNVAEEIEPLETWIQIKDQCLAAGYIINHKGIKFILDHFESCYYCIDWMTQILQNQGHCYSYFPWLIIQEDHQSTTRGDSNSQENPDFTKVKRLLGKYNYPLSNYDIKINDTAVVLITDKKYADKAMRTILDVRTKGQWYSDIVVISIDFNLNTNFKDFYNIIEVQFPQINKEDLLKKLGKGFTNWDGRELNKLNQWEKLHVFDNYFSQWDRIIYLDAGLRVLDSLEYLLALDYKDSLLAPDDSKADKHFHSQISFHDENLIKMMKEEFGEDILDRSYFLNCIWVYDTNILKLFKKEELIDIMNRYPICLTNEMAVMNLIIHFKHKLWKPFPIHNKNGKYLFEWSELNHSNCPPWQNFCYIKYPVTIKMTDSLI